MGTELMGHDFTPNTNPVVGVIGLGYVGLPTAIGFHESGFTIWGCDTSSYVIEKLKEGKNPVGDSELDEMIPPTGTEGWNISSSVRDVANLCDVILVTVPTPITTDLKPDLTYIISAGEEIFSSIDKNKHTTIVLESTVYPGVTNQVWRPLIEKNGLEEGLNVDIAYCPERFNPGDTERTVRKVARVIGCNNEQIGNGLVNFYKSLTEEDVRYVGKIEVAEAAKVIENVQRDINIALVNELARIFPAMDVDVEDVLSAAATKWNFHRYTPGVGVGGHCIPVDPYYMIQRASDVGVPAGLISAARAVNRSMPSHVASVVIDLLWKHGVSADDARVLLLGWSYKAEVGDPRETPAEPLSETLIGKGIHVAAWDPHIEPGLIPKNVESIDDISKAENFDIVILVTAHNACLELDWRNLCQNMRTPLIYDGRRVLDLDYLSSLGWEVHAVGRPTNSR